MSDRMERRQENPSGGCDNGIEDGAAEPQRSQKRILVVDDDSLVRMMLTHFLEQGGYTCQQASTGEEALYLLKDGDYEGVFCDMKMPRVSGLQLLRKLRESGDDRVVIMVTAVEQAAAAVEAMRLGADDYLVKPISSEDVFASLARALEKKERRRQIQRYTESLKTRVVHRTSQVQRLFASLIQSLITTIEAKDPYTNGHSQRVAWLGLQLAKAAGLSPRDLELIQIGGMLHDVGKIGIRGSILHKPGALTPEEYLHVKTHPEIGLRILQPLEELRDALPIVSQHHERFSGGGYPAGLRGDQIDLKARMICIADAYDAMTSLRPYRKPLPRVEAMSELRRGSGSQFDPELVDLFIAVIQNDRVQRILSSDSWMAGNEAFSSNGSPAARANGFGQSDKLFQWPLVLEPEDSMMLETVSNESEAGLSLPLRQVAQRASV